MSDLQSFDRVADVYDETRGMPPEAVAAISDAIVALLQTPSPAPYLLEVGIGTGRIAVPLAERGVRVAGIDISAAMLARLREKRTDIDVAFAEAARPPFRAAVFDGALFVHILHLVPDAAATVRAAVACVRPGGCMIMGGDDRSPGHRDEADAIIVTAMRDVAGITGTGPERHGRGVTAFEEICADAGIAIEQRVVAEWTSITSGRRMLDRLRARTFSGSWSIPDEQIDEVARQAEMPIARLYGGLDRDVPFARTFSLRFARLP